MDLLDLFILFLLALVSSRWFKELLRVARNYITDHKHVGHGNPQAHNVRRATCPATPTLRVEASRKSRKVSPLRSEDPPNDAPYVPAYKIFFPAGAPPKKQFSRSVAPCGVFKPEARDPYVPAYKLFFPAGAPPRKPFFRPVAPRRVFETEAGDPYVPAYKLFFKNSEH